MSLLDTIDGAFMNFAYGWAFSKPVRKVFYNITITALSVAVALLIGSIELLAVLADKLTLTGGRLGLRLGTGPEPRRLPHRRALRGNLGGRPRDLALRAHRGALDRAPRAGTRAGSSRARAVTAAGGRLRDARPRREELHQVRAGEVLERACVGDLVDAARASR